MSKPSIKTPFAEAYKKLNPAQKKAVDTIDGPVLVVAGPGSGKTQVLALRVAQILQETDMRPSNVLCLTFTDSASHNMRERLISFMGEDAYRVSIHTFHNLCTSIINNNPEFFYRGATLRAADDVTKYGCIEKIIEKLPYDADLRSYHPDQGYTYIKDIIATISHIKKAGLTVTDFKKVLDENDKDLIVLNERLGSILSKTVSQSSYEEFVIEFNKLHAEKGNRRILSYHSLLDALFINFNTSVTEKADFSEWKKTYAEKNTKGEYIFKDTRRADKLREVATVYEQYTELMFNQGYYDFDDMILDVLKTVEKNDILRYKIQEQYQYILVDEFQDTNDAQMRLVWLLTNNPATEGKPNIMVVGDDDQAIYKFQGAELSNIVDFTKMYSDVEVITLTENYRSNTDIVASSLSMIRTGTHRLENILKGFTKDLKSSRIFDTRNILNKKTAIDVQEFDTKLHEYTYVADQIKKAITAGVEAEHIAVIGRNHKDLVGLVPFLQKKEIPIRYEREQHVLTEPHIQQIVTILRHALGGLTELHDDILVKILAYPFWGITTLELWKLSRLAYAERKSWIDVVQEEGQSDKVVKAIEHILEITRLAAHENAEHVIDYIINTTGFRDYYFNSEKFTHEKSEYLVFLSSLRTFVQAVREFRQGKELSVSDVISFVDTYEDNKLILSDTSPFVNARNAVNLLTSHKSKGLEFEVVFILSATDKVWSGLGMPNKLKLPVNLPLAPAGDTEDDQLRLFFVALTRAKNHLYITSHRADDGGKKTNRLRFVESLGVSEGETTSVVDGESDVTNILESSMLAGNRKHVHIGPHFLDTEKALLDTLTKDHVLSITHVNNFLNIEKGGPMLFLENNLLRFPQAKTAPLGYGTALHAVLNQSLVCLKTEKRYPTPVEITEWFTTQLKFERLSKADYQTHLDRGIDALKQIYVEKILVFTGDELSEVDFKHEGVVLSDGETYVPVAGKIDLIRFADKDMRGVYVCDFKTGKEKKDWKGKDQKEKVQLHMYKQQLTFYKLLIKKSKNYNKLSVLGGQLEFLETEGERLIDLSSEIEDEEVLRLEKLVIAIYKRIQAHNFTIPAEVLGLEGLEQVEKWEEVLLGE